MQKNKKQVNDEKDFSDSINELEKEKNISQNSTLEAVKTALFNAYRSNFKQENCEVEINPETFETNVYSVRTVLNNPENGILEISLEDAKLINPDVNVGDTVKVKVDPKSFGRISVTNAKNQISQRLREEEKQVVFNEFAMKKGTCVTGKVARFIGKNLSINLGTADGLLTEAEQVPGERFKVGDRIKVYILDVTMSHKGPRILVSRTHKELIRGLFEDQVVELNDGTVEIKSISREAGSRSKIAVWSNDDDVDPVGACVGMNGDRVDSVVDQIFGEKIDIVNYDENPAYFIENALSPAIVIFVAADPDEKEASVVVPDYQLSLAIGKEGQNARLAARLTGYKIDIKSESQAREAGELPEGYESEYASEEYSPEEYDEEESESYEEVEENIDEDSEEAVDEVEQDDTNTQDEEQESEEDSDEESAE